jgi:hypothetical protein
MNAFLAELGKRLAEQWFTLLVLPGLLFVGVGAASTTLGHQNWHDVGLIAETGRRMT